MNNDEATKIFKYIQDFRAEVDDRFTASDARFDQIMSALDYLIKRQETDEHERLAINSQLDRHDGWIGQLAKSTKTKLVPEL